MSRCLDLWAFMIMKTKIHHKPRRAVILLIAVTSTIIVI